VEFGKYKKRTKILKGEFEQVEFGP
jgi:hypothetical protein